MVVSQDNIKERLCELKETLEEMVEADGDLTQKETCKFILNYMKVIGLLAEEESQ